MRCKLRIGDWAIEADVDDPDSAAWTATVADAAHQLEPREYKVAWLGPNGEPGRMAKATVEDGGRGSAVLHGREPLR